MQSWVLSYGLMAVTHPLKKQDRKKEKQELRKAVFNLLREDREFEKGKERKKSMRKML